MKVSQLKYERVAVEDVIEAHSVATEKISAAKTLDELLSARNELISVVQRFGTESSLAYARWSCNTKDEFYKTEKEYYEQNYPLLSAPRIAYIRAMLDSPLRADAEKVLPAPVFKAYEVELKTLDERIIEDLQRESALVNEYAQFMSELTY